MSRWRRRVRRLAGRLLPPRAGAVVLGYHRLADPLTAVGAEPRAMCVSPANFTAQMAALRRIGRPVSLEHLGAALEAGGSVRGMIAVTFDDGYEEVLSVALPVLEREEIPATVFFVAGNHGRPFWWDRLAVLVAAADPGAPIRVPLGGSDFVWPGTGDIEQLRKHLHRAIRVLEEVERHRVLERLGTAWSVSPATLAGGELPRALTDEQARRLAGSKWIDVGAHSVSHPPLAEIPPRRARDEIESSRAALASGLGREVRTFSYPHGSFRASTIDLVRAAGYELACSSTPDSVRPGADRHALPRVWVRDRGAAGFSRQVRRFVGSGLTSGGTRR